MWLPMNKHEPTQTLNRRLLRDQKQQKNAQAAKGFLFDQLKAQKHAQPAKGSSANMYKWRKTIKDCLLNKNAEKR